MIKRALLILGGIYSLCGCATLTQEAAQTVADQLQSSAYSNAYPAASARNPQLVQTPPKVNLAAYQSVETTVGRPYQRPDLAIAVAASGGGYRAANLTAGVLMGLEQITDPHLRGNLLEEVDYFSTVSGGGFGVGYYLASLYDFLQTYGNGPFTPQFSFTNTMNHLPPENPLDKDYRGQLFFADNRGQVIEQSLAQNILRTKNGTLTLGDIFIPATGNPADVRLPYWVTNSTIYQNANLLPFTPDVLQRYQVNRYYFNQREYNLRSVYDIPVAVGMTASASFPFALTPTTLGSRGCQGRECYLQLVDGGLADNLGVYTALDLLRQDKAKIKILLVIDAYAGDNQPFSREKTPPSGTTLFWRVMGMGTDASRQLLKHHIQELAQADLCRAGASNVLIIYLDLQNYAKARAVKTNLFITPAQQRLLLRVGQSLVQDNPEFNEELKPLVDGDLTIGRCRMRNIAALSRNEESQNEQ